MSDNYIQLLRSDKTDWLQEHFPNAFILLMYIARKSLRYPKEDEGLLAGDLIVGRHETSRKAGLSEKQYRNALQKLEDLGFIETVYNPIWNQQKSGLNKTSQKRAIKRAIKSIVICLINSEVCNININNEGQQGGQQGASKGPQRKNEEEMKESSSYLNKEMKMKEENKKIISVSFPDLRNQEIFVAIKVYSDSKNLPLKENVLHRWVLKYPEKLIMETLNAFLKKEDFSGNHEAWMETTLSKKYDFKSNSEFIAKFKEDNKWYELTITKNYCRDEETKNDYQFSLNHEEFVRIIENKFNQKEREKHEIN